MSTTIPNTQEIAAALMERVRTYQRLCAAADPAVVRGKGTFGSIEDAIGWSRGRLKKFEAISNGADVESGFNTRTADELASFLDREIARLEAGAPIEERKEVSDEHREEA